MTANKGRCTCALKSAIIRSFKRSFKGINHGSYTAPSSVGISELKANPTAVLEASGNKPVAILNRNKPVGYMLTAGAWEKFIAFWKMQNYVVLLKLAYQMGRNQ
jgi:antitoxin StbD